MVNKTDLKKKIRNLVNKGYHEGAFSRKENAKLFAKLWADKGNKDIGVFRSSGPTVEGSNWKRNAYYVVAGKLKKKK